MACRLPGAENLDAFWSLLRDGRCAISALPPDRLDQNLYYCAEKGVPGTTYARLGGVVPTPELSTQPEEYDVSHRILLDVASEACRDAGWNPAALPTHRRNCRIPRLRSLLQEPA
jgi:acyl transferase domain-containing protein